MRGLFYGPGSGKLTSLQLELLEFEPGISNVEVSAEGEREALPPSSEKKKLEHPGRQTLPADLARVERVIACTSEQCVCAGCGQSTTLIGYEESEQLDVEPAKYFVLVTKREKRACKRCEERGVMPAPLPARIIDMMVLVALLLTRQVPRWPDALDHGIGTHEGTFDFGNCWPRSSRTSLRGSGEDRIWDIELRG